MTSPIPPQETESDWRLRVCPKCGQPILPSWDVYYVCDTRECDWTGKRLDAPFGKGVA